MLRLLALVPIVALLALTSILCMAARAPRTWAQHWTPPRGMVHSVGGNDFAALPNQRGGWDLLYTDDEPPNIAYSSVAASGGGGKQVLAGGNISDPALGRIGRTELAVWVHQKNSQTDVNDLDAAYLRPGARPQIFHLVRSAALIEHPHVFRGAGNTWDVVFSWQRYGNYDVFLLRMPSDGTKPTLLRRLTRARFYSFEPQAVSDRQGTIHMLHLENCCQQQVWNVAYDRYTANGAHLGRTVTADRIYGLGKDTIPNRWLLQMSLNQQGQVLGAFQGDNSITAFEVRHNGSVVNSPHTVGVSSQAQGAGSLVTDKQGGYVFWEEQFDLGSYIYSERLNQNLEPAGPPERVAYEARTETDPHAALIHGRPTVIWQATTAGGNSTFTVSSNRGDTAPTLAQRLGLGLGDPWGDVAILVVAAAGVATFTTVGNIFMIFGLALFGILAMRLLRRLPGGWLVYGALLTLLLYLSFVAPGGPILFLATMPALGLSAVPFGLVAALCVLGSVWWLGGVALRRVEVPYRAALMALVGVYFFAFVEAVVFLQQRLGYI